MTTIQLKRDIELFYEIDDFTDPWREPEPIIFLHGLAESGEAWRPWIPHFSRHYRTIRYDARGFGRSTAMPESFKWSIDVPVDDLAEFADALGLESFHLISAKFGGTVAMRFAARFPKRVKTLAVVSSPTSLRASLGNQIPVWDALVRKHGVQAWCDTTMAGRLGSAMPPQGTHWWSQHMGATAQSTVLGIFRTLADIDVTGDLPAIECPTLVVTTTGSGLGSVDAVRAWQQKIPRSELMTIDSDSYHIAASQPDRCAEAVRAFIARPR